MALRSSDRQRVTFPDWFNNGPVAIDANGRINGNNSYDSVNGGNPNVYQENLGSITSTSGLTSITLSYDTTPGRNGGGHTDIVALSGTFVGQVPEPSSIIALVGLIGMGCIGLVVRHNNRRRFAAAVAAK